MNTLYIFGIIIKSNMHKKYKLSDNSNLCFYPYTSDRFWAKYNNACSTNRLVIKTTVTALEKMAESPKLSPPNQDIIHFIIFVNIQKNL